MLTSPLKSKPIELYGKCKHNNWFFLLYRTREIALTLLPVHNLWMKKTRKFCRALSSRGVHLGVSV